MFACWSLCSFLSLLLPFFSGLVDARAYNATAGLSSTWIANNSPYQDLFFPLSPILLREHNGSGMDFTCGFYFFPTPKVYYFSIFVGYSNQTLGIDQLVDPIMVWSANRNNPVSENATLELTAEGDLVLTDVDGSVAWSTNTTGMSVAGMNLTHAGNLVLFDKNNATVWQSFDHPADSLVFGQKLTPSTSPMNWTKQGFLSLSLTPSGLFAQTETDPPQVYFHVQVNFPNASDDSNYIEFIKGALALFMNSIRKGSVLGFDSEFLDLI